MRRIEGIRISYPGSQWWEYNQTYIIHIATVMPAYRCCVRPLSASFGQSLATFACDPRLLATNGQQTARRQSSADLAFYSEY